MATPINFESSRIKEVQREEIKRAREQVLNRAKDKYEREERKKELAKQRGEDKWMLPSVSARIDQESDKKSKKHKKEKKKHKEKKQKKRKKMKHQSSNSSDSGSDNEPTWIENSAVAKTTETTVKGPSLQRDSWMTDTPDVFGGVTRQELRDKKKQEQMELEPEKNNTIDQAGQHERELNPYWKDGGTGLPEEKPKATLASSTSLSTVCDGGLEWLRISYKRCQEMAKEEGRSLDDVAAERWGSLEKLESMLREAEKAQSRGKDFSRDNRNRESCNRHRESRLGYKRSVSPENRSRHRDKNRSKSPKSVSYRDRSRSPKYRRSSPSRTRSRSPEYHSGSSHHRSKSPRERDQYHYSDNRGRDSHKYHRYKEKLESDTKLKSLSGKFMKPGDNDRNKLSEQTVVKDTPGWKKKGFLKPGEGSRTQEKPSWRRDNHGRDDTPSWKKKEYIKPKEEAAKRKASSSSDSSPSSDSASSELESEEEQNEIVEDVPVLTEQQMNEMGAKILRAELMGDEELASKLKLQIERARKAKESQPKRKADKQDGSKMEEEDEEEVLLTRTTKSGMVLPVSERVHPQEHGKKRRKKLKVATHDNKGVRERFFDDDDKFDLKTMVEREKMGTAEDQNMMFARLAGRAVEKTDDDYQIDDVFIGRATKKQSDAKHEEHDRSMAVSEHRKKAAALEKCRFCFENVPKHLIIAIGVKVYLCLPNHKSLTEGHCLIVPMQHVASGTTVDEDVWEEIQIYRKILTKMFSDRDEDCVFMETVMRLRHFPHMVLECVPMPKEVGDMAPIYFKKAITESESEWAQNKKLVDLAGKDVRRAIPKGFPYFAVDFGIKSGFAHVIEDEQTFPSYFGKEIVGGMLDADTQLWRKPHRENFDDQRQKVLEFAQWWKPYDWTQKLKHDDSD